MSKINVAAWQEKEGNTLTDDKLIRINDNKPEFGSVMVSSQVREFAPGGFTNKRTKVAFITGRMEDLKEMIKDHKLKNGSDFNAIFGDHKIVTVEKLETQVGPKDGFSEKMNPTTGEILTSDGVTIVRRTYLVGETSPMVDVLIAHDRDEVAADPAVKEFDAAMQTGKK